MAEDSDSMPTCEEAAAVLTGMYHRTECSGSFENDLKRQRIFFGNNSSIGEHIEESINALSDIFQAYKKQMNNQAQIDTETHTPSQNDNLLYRHQATQRTFFHGKSIHVTGAVRTFHHYSFRWRDRPRSASRSPTRMRVRRAGSRRLSCRARQPSSLHFRPWA